MNKEIKIYIFFVLFGILILTISHFSIHQKESKCHDLGGVYIENKCFKADLIKLD